MTGYFVGFESVEPTVCGRVIWGDVVSVFSQVSVLADVVFDNNQAV